MMRRAAVLPAALLTLAACSGTPAQKPSETANPTAASDSASFDRTPTAVAPGRSIKAGATLPTTLDHWAGTKKNSTMTYESGISTITAEIRSTDYATAVKDLRDGHVAAGTGQCGISKVNVEYERCYLKAADGVVVLQAAPMDTPMDGLMTFANSLTTTLGTD